jgi:hypothetical protein
LSFSCGMSPATKPSRPALAAADCSSITRRQQASQQYALARDTPDACACLHQSPAWRCCRCCCEWCGHKNCRHSAWHLCHLWHLCAADDRFSKASVRLPYMRCCWCCRCWVRSLFCCPAIIADASCCSKLAAHCVPATRQQHIFLK